MIDAIKLRWFYGICIAFAIINLLAIANNFPWVGVIPGVLVVAFLLLFQLDAMLLLLAFLVPLSSIFDDVGFGLGISLPDEPLIILITIFALFKFFLHSEYDYRVFRHPITIVILVNLFWIFLTTCTSQFPLISVKFLLSRFWYIVVFYFLGIILFRKLRNITLYWWLYIIPLAGDVLFTLYKHSKFSFSLARSYDIMQPFFIDHGIYAATLSIVIPLLACFVLFYKRMGLNLMGLIMAACLLVILLYGIYFSYTRAAWIGVAAAGCFAVPLLLRIRFNTLLVIVCSFVGFVYVFQDEIIYLFSKNEQKSANGFSQHFQSITNIKTDPSNTERINRWMSAIAMFNEKPVTGFGPGTYSFAYAPFQEAKNLTVISTNFGDGGNAHSEYLNPLAESGLLGLLTFLLIIYAVLATGFRLYYTASRFRVRMYSAAILLGLVTYFVHGLLNNYSETDKVGALLWTGFGMLTALDIYHNPQAVETPPTHEPQ